MDSSWLGESESANAFAKTRAGRANFDRLQCSGIRQNPRSTIGILANSTTAGTNPSAARPTRYELAFVRVVPRHGELHDHRPDGEEGDTECRVDHFDGHPRSLSMSGAA